MRTIKFRAFDKKSQKMFSKWKDIGAHIVISFDGNTWVLDDDDGGKNGLHEHDITEDYDLILMQFTGLLDKNGVEIFEGDIISDGYSKDIVEFGKIGYDGKKTNGLTGFEVKRNYVESKDYYELSYYTNFDEYEVIGNIYENPELMKGEL